MTVPLASEASPRAAAISPTGSARGSGGLDPLGAHPASPSRPELACDNRCGSACSARLEVAVFVLDALLPTPSHLSEGRTERRPQAFGMVSRATKEGASAFLVQEKVWEWGSRSYLAPFSANRVGEPSRVGIQNTRRPWA